MTYNVTEAADKGARLLDSAQPGWAHRIDLAELDLECTYSCVLGQLEGSYSRGMEAIEAPTSFRSRWSQAHGFMVQDDTADEYEENGGAVYEDLTEAWREEIEPRLYERYGEGV